MSEDSRGKIHDLFKEIARGYEQICREVKEAIEDISIASESDITFNGLKNEIAYLQKKIKSNGLSIVETLLAITEVQETGNKLIEIEIKCEKDQKRFKKIEKLEVRDILTLPIDLQNQLEHEKYVKFKILQNQEGEEGEEGKASKNED